VYSNIISSINGLDIMVTLNGIDFEYIKIICNIFANYIVPILQVYPNHFILLLKIITNDIYYYYYIFIFILITCDKKIDFNIIFHQNVKTVISYYMMIMMILE
jgi:hypothetical protein